MSLVRIERVKLFASLLNIVDAGCLIGMIVTVPLTSMINDRLQAYPEVTFMLILFVIAVSCEGVAQLLLGMLKP